MAGCSQDSTPDVAKADGTDRPSAAISSSETTASLRRSAVASLPDRGELLDYQGQAAPIERGATKWYPVRLSEEHALRAVTTGTLTMRAPDGRPMDIQYKRHVEHKNGNWTWIGKMKGAAPGQEAVFTFGEKAVFGSIPDGNGEPLKITMNRGQGWLVQTDPLLAAANPVKAPTEADFLIPGDPGPLDAGALMASADTAPPMVGLRPEYMHTSSHATVDIALGYTTGLAASLGGQSQAITRLTHLVDLANQAYTASGVDGELRLVRTVMVGYTDASSNRRALFDLTGVNCGPGSEASLPGGSVDCQPAERPEALMPLIEARETYGADVVALVRRFEAESGSCGIGWMLGGGQQEITSADADFAMSVISDSSTEGSCREDTLAHEVGHNMGLQHDLQTAQGNDDTNNDGNLLDPEEYGRFPYAFGHSTGAGEGSFYTVMSVRRPGQVGYLVFSNPNVTSCGGFACGVADQADNARALNQTMAVLAGFRATTVPRGIVPSDFNGDGVSDLLWRNVVNGQNALWLGADSTTPQAVSPVPSQAWRAVGAGDFNGDGVSDLFWRNNQDGQNLIWLSGNLATSQPVATVHTQDWQVAGIGDFNGDGISDLFWRNSRDGRNAIWLSADVTRQPTVSGVSNQDWRVSGVGDFNGDGMSDLFWRNRTNGQNVIWLSANSATSLTVATIPAQSWQVAATGDFNGDGDWDLFWRNSSDGRNAIWPSADLAQLQDVPTIPNRDWKIANAGDYNGDGVSDLFWRNSRDGRNTIWLSANSATPQAAATVSNQAWTIVR